MSDLLSFDLPLLEGVSPSAVAQAGIRCQERTLAPWEILFNQQDTSKDVFFLLSGSLMAVYWTPDGREIIFNRFAIGSYLGELAALDDGPRSLAVVARGEAQVLVLQQQSFLALFHKVELVRQRVAVDLVDRVRKLTTRNVELTSYTVEQRVASYLIALAMERGRLEEGGILDDAPTHAEIAASIGVNREIVSRTMTRLSNNGIVRTARRRIELLNPDALSDLI